jgi:hypothetical protein
VLEPISDSVEWLVQAGHDVLGLPWGWTLVLLGAALHALTLALQDAVDAQRHRLAAIASRIPETVMFVGLVVALGGELRGDMCPAVNPPGIADPRPCGDLAAFAVLGDVTGPGAVSTVLFAAGALAAAVWALRRWVPARSGLAGVALASAVAAVVATGTLPYAIGAIAVAAYVGLLRSGTGTVA